jgi:hypothetical protein
LVIYDCPEQQQQVLRPRDPALTHCHSGATVTTNTSPLEYLLAYAIVFVTGVLTTIGFGKYLEQARKNARHA